VSKRHKAFDSPAGKSAGLATGTLSSRALDKTPQALVLGGVNFWVKAWLKGSVSQVKTSHSFTSCFESLSLI
jgi:hypothetical protein